jgi:hypothetical protein
VTGNRFSNARNMIGVASESVFRSSALWPQGSWRPWFRCFRSALLQLAGLCYNFSRLKTRSGIRRIMNMTKNQIDRT